MMATMATPAARTTLPSRWSVLGVGLAGGAAAVLAACESETRDSPGPGSSTSTPSATPSAAPPPEFDPGDWESVRAQFPLDPELAQFAAFVLSSTTPEQVDAAVAAIAELV